MPGKYSYNAVLSDYSSQGLIPLSNTKQIEYERESGTETARSANRARSQSALKARSTHGIPPVSGQRVVIQDSDSECDSLPSVRAQTSQSHRVSYTPQRQPRLDRTQRKQVRIEKPLPSPPKTSTPARSRPGGVRAFIAARYQEEVGALPGPGSSLPDLSLHEFLNSVSQKPETTKHQPRDDHLVPPKSSASSHNRDISVKEFLNLVPSPPPELGSGLPHKPQNPPVSSGAHRSLLVSRLPKGVELPARQTREPISAAKRSGLPQSSRPEARAQPALSDVKARTPQISKTVAATQRASPRAVPASHEPPKKLERGQPKKTPPQEHFGKDYSLDFDGFADTEVSYFPHMGPAVASTAPLDRVSSLKSSTRRSDTPQSATTVLAVSGRGHRLGPTRSKPEQNVDFTATPPISPQDSTFHTDDQLSPGNESATTYERSIRSPQPPKLEHKRRNSGSWSLPAIQQSVSNSNSFSNMFEDRGGRNVLIFTSDEEDSQEEVGETDEDDLPTPRIQKLEEDVRFPSNEWGMISAGKQFTPDSKDPDNMSDGSAVYPPDIGRRFSGSESPLALALQSMRHGGELGAAYKPPQSRFMLRNTVNASEILGRLGLKKTSVMNDKASTMSSSTSGKSRDQARPYHPASSSRGRLPVSK